MNKAKPFTETKATYFNVVRSEAEIDVLIERMQAEVNEKKSSQQNQAFTE